MKGKHFYLFLLCLGIAFIFFCRDTFFKESGMLDGDSITHYYFAHYALRYPHLMLDVWGKPFFILISSPFAYFGFGAMQAFNILCACVSAFFVYKTLDLLGVRYKFIAPLVLFFVPVYLINIASGLTEILFGLVLILGVYTSLREKYILSALLLSFLPYCRSEGYFIIPVFLLVFLINRSYKAIPFLLSGSIIYAIVCYFACNDFLWMFHKNPYHYDSAAYGHGTLWYFLANTDRTFGYPIAALFVIGLGYTAYRSLMRPRNGIINRTVLSELLLIYGIPLLYLGMHSIFWWKGIFGSAGMLRVLAGVAPVFSVGAITGLDRLIKFLKGRNLISGAICLAILVLIIWYPDKVIGLPLHQDERGITVRRACEWIEANHLDTCKFYNSDALSPLYLDKDPYDPKEGGSLMGVSHSLRGTDIPKGSIVLWESLMGPHECTFPLAWLQDKKYFSQLKMFMSPYDNVNDSNAFRAYVFKKIR